MKRFRVRFIKEDAITQPATKPADVSFDETQQQIENTEEEKQENALLANSGLQPQDVDNMTDGAVLGTMLSPNQEIQDDTLQALGKKATDFVNKVSTNTITPDEKKDIGNEVVANFKTAQQTGFAESILWDDLETKILKEMLNYDSHNLERFSKTIVDAVTDTLQEDSGMNDWDAGTKIWEFVKDWVERHPRFMRELWWETHDRPNDNPTKEQVHKVKRQLIHAFIEKFSK